MDLTSKLLVLMVGFALLATTFSAAADSAKLNSRNKRRFQGPWSNDDYEYSVYVDDPLTGEAQPATDDPPTGDSYPYYPTDYYPAGHYDDVPEFQDLIAFFRHTGEWLEFTAERILEQVDWTQDEKYFFRELMKLIRYANLRFFK